MTLLLNSVIFWPWPFNSVYSIISLIMSNVRELYTQALLFQSQAGCRFLCASVPQVTCRILPRPAPVLPHRHFGGGGDGCWRSRAALHHSSCQFWPSSFPRVYSTSLSQTVWGQGWPHQVSLFYNHTLLKLGKVYRWAKHLKKHAQVTFHFKKKKRKINYILYKDDPICLF